MQVALFAFHKALQRTSEVQNPYAHARTILQRAMWGYYSTSGAQFAERALVELPDESQHVAPSSLLRRYHIHRGMMVAAFAGLDGRAQDSGTQAELLELDDYLAALERTCGSIAKEIVSNLMCPSGECCRKLLAEVARKQQMQQRLRSASRTARRHQPRGVQNEIRLSQRAVRNALGLSASEWNRNMTNIKAFTRRWLTQ